MEQPKQSLGQKWSAARPTKTVVVWSWIASIIVTMIIGFTWGGWVTGGTAQKMADTGTWEQTDYVKKQGWATMPGEREPDSKVAGECVKLLLLIS